MRDALRNDRIVAIAAEGLETERVGVIDPGREKIFRSVMRFTLCSVGDELNSRSPIKGTTDTISEGGKSGRDLFTQPREAPVRAGVSEQGNRRRGIPWPPAEESRASPAASALSCSLRFGDSGPIPARPPANH